MDHSRVLKKVLLFMNGLITPFKVRNVLQILAIGLLCLSPCFGFVKYGRASEARRPIKFPAASIPFEDITNYPALFGAHEQRSGNLNAFTKWLGVFARFDQEMKDEHSARVIRTLNTQLSHLSSRSLFEMAKNVDTMMNQKKYIVDKKNWGTSDYWETLTEFIQYGGDCEDFAIAKYIALRSLGVPDSRLRVAIVQDLKKNVPHAVLIAYTERGAYVLDNQSDVMHSADAVKHYKPIYSINRHAWWLHTSPGRNSNNIVASAR